MATRVHVDPSLLAKAQRAGRHPTKTETVNEALRQYVLRQEQLRILDLFGTVDFDPDYDYRAVRRR